MTIDWNAKLQHLLQTLAFCLAVASIQFAFMPERSYAPGVVYSILVGTIIWVVVDIGRHAMPSAAETGWPKGFSGVLLVAAGIVAGYFFGNKLGDAICQAFGLFGPRGMAHTDADLRSGMLITLLAGIAGSYWFYSRNRSGYLERQVGEVQRHAKEARLKLLETQLEPHMLFNTLANLRALIGVDAVRAQEMLDHMIAYLRATLDASRAATHPLQAEFDRLRDYLELMAIRMGPRLAYTLELPAELAGLPVPALLLQPLVENSIKHGLEPKVQGGRITVRAHRDGPALVLEVRDTGVGDARASGDGPGFGLTQVRERLAALYGAQARMDFALTPEGAHTRIALPVS
ncbi:histidine kinase [Ramlibacter sp. PS3R-8]|uniref:sensor histidine kinase n=1 Tax=Ramlibacter sp. PS3R-8 TaxID=3133437 RepID=UPI0030A4244B